MFSKENKENSKSLFQTYDENAGLKLLGKKTNQHSDDSELNENSSKTKIHGIIFKKNDSEKKVKKITCNCKNSQCLKLYCECFSKLAFCDPDICSCKGCANTKENEKSRDDLINLYLTKNTKTFKRKLNFLNRNSNAMNNISIDSAHKSQFEAKSSSSVDSIKLTFNNYEKGCTCKKSNCQKKYCECFQNGASCSYLCKCVDCKNSKIEIKTPDSTRSSNNYSNKNIINTHNISESNVKNANLNSEFIKEEIDQNFALIEFKKRLIEPCKIIIKDYKLTEEQTII